MGVKTLHLQGIGSLKWQTQYGYQSTRPGSCPLNPTPILTGRRQTKSSYPAITMPSKTFPVASGLILAGRFSLRNLYAFCGKCAGGFAGWPERAKVYEISGVQ